MIKLRCGKNCCIYEQNYDNSLTKIQRLIDEARRDFPGLNNADIRIVVYGGRQIKGMMGVEFVAQNLGLILDTYQFVNDLPPTLH